MELKLETLLASINFDLQKLDAEMEVLKSQWDGDDSGDLEDRAKVAGEIVEKSKELRSLMAELNESF